MQLVFKGEIKKPDQQLGRAAETPTTKKERKIVFFTGISLLLMVPVFKAVTHLPPFMGMLAALGLMWIITEIIHSGKADEDRKNFTVSYALRKIDTPSILFFLGILLAISALESTEQLKLVAEWMDTHLKDQNVIVGSFGLIICDS